MARLTPNLTPVVIGLGSNLDSPAEQVSRAMRKLAELLEEMRSSGLYSSAPMYLNDQPEFVNAVCTGLSHHGPLALHARLKQIEQEAGRTKTVPNGPRVIDLDLIAYGCLELRSPGLALPHLRAMERRFVVEPWLEVSEGLESEPLRRALAAEPLLSQSIQRLNNAVV
ncbi:MAG: 2-amino-4-hydroxy-6-hydroxymethyldihydropteridine diphosphokinase [Fimbriimonadaceae bacterium]